MRYKGFDIYGLVCRIYDTASGDGGGQGGIFFFRETTGIFLLKRICPLCLPEQWISYLFTEHSLLFVDL